MNFNIILPQLAGWRLTLAPMLIIPTVICTGCWLASGFLQLLNHCCIRRSFVSSTFCSGLSLLHCELDFWESDSGEGGIMRILWFVNSEFPAVSRRLGAPVRGGGW